MYEEERKVKRAWKTAAVIFGIILLIESLLIGAVVYRGWKMVIAEEECQVNVCKSFESYYYHPTDNTCHCYEGNELILSTHIV